MTRPAAIVAFVGLVAAGGLIGASPAVQAPPPSREELDQVIDRLGAFDYDERMRAAQFVRRSPGTVALPALVDAAAGHADGFVRYRALVLLSGYDDPRVPDQMEQALGDVNERLRSVACAYFERHLEPRLIPAFLTALDTEGAEFVRPALLRALAAHGRDARVRAALLKEVTRGRLASRRALIEALGDYRAVYALKAISVVAQSNGPLSDEAVVAVGKLADPSSVALLTGVQQTARPELLPSVATALCLLGSHCETQRGFLLKTLTAPDQRAGGQDVSRSAALGLSALAAHGDIEAGRALLDVGVSAAGPERAFVALALARLALGHPPVAATLIDGRQDRDRSLALLRQGFVGLEDDFNKEQFFVALRQAYHAEPDGSPRRTVIQALINALEF